MSEPVDILAIADALKTKASDSVGAAMVMYKTPFAGFAGYCFDMALADLMVAQNDYRAVKDLMTVLT